MNIISIRIYINEWFVVHNYKNILTEKSKYPIFEYRWIFLVDKDNNMYYSFYLIKRMDIVCRYVIYLKVKYDARFKSIIHEYIDVEYHVVCI